MKQVLFPVLFATVFALSLTAEAARNPHYKNIQYMTLVTRTEACTSLLPQPSHESIECLYFDHEVKSPRESGSGLAEGRRSSARLTLKPELPDIAARVAELVRLGKIEPAQRVWKTYLQKVAQLPYPVDVNETILWIAREVYIKSDVELDLRLKDFASTAEALGLASDQVDDYEKLLTTCGQLPNCDTHEIQESLQKAREALQTASSGNEMAMIKLQAAISARGQLIQLVANMIAAFNETTKSIVGNIR